MPRFQARAIVILLLICPGFLLADTVLLRNGQRIEGKIVGQSRTTVRIATAGGTRSIPKDKVRRIVYGGNDKAKEEQERKRKEREERLQKLREKRQKELEEKQKADEEARKNEEEREALEAARRAERERLALEAAASEEVTLTGAVVRSALLPGLGQLYQGRTGAGAAYLSAFFLLGAGTGAAIAHHEHTRSGYLAAAEEALIYTPFFFDLVAPVSPINSSTLSRHDFTTFGLYHQSRVAAARAEMVEAGQVADMARTALLAFYLWNLTDVFLFHPDDGSSTTMGFMITPETAAIQFQFRF